MPVVVSPLTWALEMGLGSSERTGASSLQRRRQRQSSVSLSLLFRQDLVVYSRLVWNLLSFCLSLPAAETMGVLACLAEASSLDVRNSRLS